MPPPPPRRLVGCPLTTMHPLLAVSGAIGQDETFSVEPTAENIVPEKSEVVLECVTTQETTCAWKLKVSGLSATGVLNTQVDEVSGRPSGTYQLGKLRGDDPKMDLSRVGGAMTI